MITEEFYKYFRRKYMGFIFTKKRSFSASKFVIVIAFFFLGTYAFSAPEVELCSGLSAYFSNTSKKELKLPNPSRYPTEKERLLIDKWKIELLEHTDYAMGVSIVDADNDGKEDLFAWNVQGTGRFVYAELFDFPLQRMENFKEASQTAQIQIGILETPHFVRFRG